MSTPPLTLLNLHFETCKEKDKSLYGFITAIDRLIEFTCVNAETGKIKFSLPILSKELKELLANFKFNGNAYKAVIVDVNIVQAPIYLNVMDFCKELKQKLTERNVPNYFIPKTHYEYTALLASANIKTNIGDIVYIIISYVKMISFAELQYTSAGYAYIRSDMIDIDPKVKQHNNIAEKIFGQIKPKKVIAMQDPRGYCIKKLLKNVKMVILYGDMNNFREKFVVESCKWILDKSYTKFRVLPWYDRNFFAFDSLGNAEPNEYENGVPIMYAYCYDQLPLTKAAVFSRTTNELVLLLNADYGNNQKINYNYKPALKRDCHQFKLNISIDEECFETFSVEQIILDEIKTLPSKLDEKMEAKIPVIGFFDNSSVILINNKNGKYQFLEACNGMLGCDNYISFDEKQIKYGQEAVEMLSTKASSVVYDILKIMSKPPKKVKVVKACQFRITKDCDHPILIEFDNDEDGRSAASPAFLMALLIKHYSRAVRKKIGKKPREIGFWIYDQFNEDEKKRIKQGLEESCQLLRIKGHVVDC